VYLRGHEGRGIGIAEKLRAYALQEQGADTVDANLQLGFPPDTRSYDTAGQIIRDLQLRSVRLLTNNPAKSTAIEAQGIHVVDRIPLQTTPTEENLRYLETKRDRLGHALTLDGPLVELFDPA
ncbi:MAG: bifunctional 3,4-dihydroxy-2-butanone-4-phosphate synthase/GTP cyclohydrolase II, partial [Actinomycetota bacterium]